MNAVNENRKACADCRWRRNSGIEMLAMPLVDWCTNPHLRIWCDVNGYQAVRCSDARREEDLCGKNAVGWQRKLKLHERLSQRARHQIVTATLFSVILPIAAFFRDEWVLAFILAIIPAVLLPVAWCALPPENRRDG